MHYIKNLLKKFHRGDKVSDASVQLKTDVNRNLNADFVEHTLDRAELAALFPQSGIHVENPSKSVGLKSGKFIR
jgi:hypothetical protein